MLDNAKALEMETEMVLEMALEMAIAMETETATETAIALAVKGVQLVRVKPVVQHRHRAVALVVAHTPKAPALTVTVAARATVAAVPKIAAAIAVLDLQHAARHHAVMVARNSVALEARLI
jgi:hypothetical protein|tara:strand:- start:117 stop:479 length:363 start_codon:yes stop_codon:yes gene_type:complete